MFPSAKSQHTVLDFSAKKEVVREQELDPISSCSLDCSFNSPTIYDYTPPSPFDIIHSPNAQQCSSGDTMPTPDTALNRAIRSIEDKQDMLDPDFVPDVSMSEEEDEVQGEEEEEDNEGQDHEEDGDMQENDEGQEHDEDGDMQEDDEGQEQEEDGDMQDDDEGQEQEADGDMQEDDEGQEEDGDVQDDDEGQEQEEEGEIQEEDEGQAEEGEGQEQQEERGEVQENVYEVENVHEAEEIKLQVIDELDEHHILVRIPWEHLPNGSVLDAGGCMIERG